MSGLVDFFVAGVQKGGTTALARYLDAHPQIQMSSIKEVHHFDDEKRVDWSLPDHGRLHDHFDWSVAEVVRGEATPIYSYWPEALGRMRAYNREAQLIVGLRHPSLRAFSQWRMERSRFREILPFEAAVGEEGRSRVAAAPGGVHRDFSYVERGFYSPQVERMQRLFPRAQVHVFRTDRLWSDPTSILGGIERFLGVGPYLGDTVQARYIVPLQSTEPTGMPAEVRARLDALYHDDIVTTARFLDLDLSDWLSPHYQEPMGAA